MTNDEIMTRPEAAKRHACALTSSFAFRASFVIRHSGFVILPNVTIAHRLETCRHHFAHVALGRERFAKWSRLVKESSLLLRIQPPDEKQHMTG